LLYRKNRSKARCIFLIFLFDV